MSAMQRRKGAQWERDVANAFREAGFEAKRGLGQCRAAGEVPDVDVPGWWVEAKHHQKTNPRAALAQAIEASGTTGRTPIAVCKDNGCEPVVMLRFEDFLNMACELRMLRKFHKETVEC